MHARKLKHLKERFVWYAQAIEPDPASCRGRWARAHMPAAREVRLDLGCGKGQFTVAEALEHPDVLFVGVDCEEVCIARAAQEAVERKAGNVVFALYDATAIAELFAPAELAHLYLNFPTPHPRKKYAGRRLTNFDRLAAYRDLLVDDALVELRTDSRPFWEYSLVQFDLAAYDVLEQGEDMRSSYPDLPAGEYELRLAARGATTHYCIARKAHDRPVAVEQTAELSLVKYLPADLDGLDYVPYGMERAVMNLRHVRAKERRRAEGGR